MQAFHSQVGCDPYKIALSWHAWNIAQSGLMRSGCAKWMARFVWLMTERNARQVFRRPDNIIQSKFITWPWAFRAARYSKNYCRCRIRWMPDLLCCRWIIRHRIWGWMRGTLFVCHIRRSSDLHIQNTTHWIWIQLNICYQKCYNEMHLYNDIWLMQEFCFLLWYFTG